MRNDHSIAMLCDNLRWSRIQRVLRLGCAVASAPGLRAREDQALVDANRRHPLPKAAKPTALPGSHDELRAHGRRHGRNRIARLMKSQGICGRQKGRYRVQTTDSNHDHPIAPNHLAEGSHRPLPPTRSGSLTSPTSPPPRAGFISPVSWTSTAAKSLAGP